MSQEEPVTTVCITKLDAARRQLRVGIQLLFDNGDPVVVHTLIGAASTIISNLTERQHPDESWDKFACEANNLTAKEYFTVMREAQNFLKHAKDDPDATFNLCWDDTEGLAFFATVNFGTLSPTFIEADVFQLWYLACHAPNLNAGIEPYPRVLEIFGDLRITPRVERLAAAKRVLDEQLASAEK